MAEITTPESEATHRFTVMTAAELREALKHLRIRQGDFAALADMSREHVNRMVAGKRTIPRSVPVLLALMARCDAWRGDADWRDWPSPIDDAVS
jgi:hypothetical protein